MNYDRIQELLVGKLNSNKYDILFDVEIFNSPNHDYEIKVNSEEGYGVDVKRVVPTMISAPFGDNLPIPDTFGVDGNMEILFDIFVGDETKFINKEEEDRFKSVNFHKTISSIQDFISETLSKVQNLGETSLFFGGEDSILTATGTNTPYDSVYIELEPQDLYEESIFKTDTIEIIRSQSGTFRFIINGVTANTTIQYSLGEKTQLLLWHDGTTWYLNDDTTNTITDTTQSTTTITMGYGGGLNAKVYDVRLGSNSFLYSDLANIDAVEWTVLYADFEDIDNVINIGSSDTIFNPDVSNCILWGEDGNMLLGFTTLIPNDTVTIDKGYKYQRFSLSVPFLYSKDIVFGNHFRYYMNLDPNDDGVFDNSDDFQVFAVDRQHTYGSETTSKQNITENIGKSIINESMRDISKTFVYKPNREMTKLLKKVMTSTVEQNKRYRLKVQAPFFTTYYECIVESGGNGTELYSFSTFTLQLKEVLKFD